MKLEVRVLSVLTLQTAVRKRNASTPKPKQDVTKICFC